ncbi:hypothetical protein CRE_10463 [Caenorhabditis remanei]|uniref:F-box domain-containing protein n=1 Tax=Caenorhabditis remanei TaxID=31234 RepID=E3N0M5_CAERE|nr:hypothetical protein CRE_10463 [Caenorhabditis remanei]
MTTAFPLLRLPYLVLMPILEQMEFIERIALSILSRRARMFVKLLKMKCKHINLILKDNIIKMIVFHDNSEEVNVQFHIHRYQNVDLNYGYGWWRGRPSSIQYALLIMDVTNCKSIKKLIIAEASEYDTLSYEASKKFLTNLPKIDEVVVEDTNSQSFSPDSGLQTLLSTILPVSSTVTKSVHVQKPEHLREICKGNFDAVTVENYWKEYEPNSKIFALSDLRMTNAKSLELPGRALEIEDLNRFFKLWMKKSCNPRLEYLRVVTSTWAKSDILNLLLKGINAVQIPIRTDRKFRVLGNIKQFISEIHFGEDEILASEFDITRADGRQATIRMGTHGTVCFYVWPESTDDTTNIEPNQYLFTRKFSRLSSFYNSCIERFK